MNGRAILLVRAELKYADDRPAFDQWYQAEHLPAALAAFKADRAWRCWSATSPQIHYAFYEFGDTPTARSALNSADMAVLISEFDRRWGTRIVRSRDIIEIVQTRSA